jgi:hypothetical protein
VNVCACWLSKRNPQARRCSQSMKKERQIRHPFQPLIDAQLIEVDVLARATPDCLHEMVLV